MRNTSAGIAVKPEVDKLTSHILCIYGEDDHDSLCPALKTSPRVDVVMLKGSHHFDGNYERLGRIVLEHLR